MNINNMAQVQSFLHAPEQKEDFENWIKQEDVFPFLDKEMGDEHIIIYAGLPFAFIHAVFIPNTPLEASAVEDLMEWSCNPYDSWGISASIEDVWIEGPLENSRSKLLSQGEQLLFIRTFDGVESQRRYFELQQKVTHVLGLHYLSERNAWCRLDQNGDIEDVVKILEFNDLPERQPGTIVTMNKNVLAKYAGIENYSLCRMFDFTRYKKGMFPGWGDNEPVRRSNGNDIYGRFAVVEEYGSYSRGIQVKDIGIPKGEIINEMWGRTTSEEGKQYATFIADDWKNKRIAEISCDPSCLGNYFVESDLPFELSPAFFRPEVLLKYKSDREKYQLGEREVGCRGTWHLKTFDVNEAGQVHTYLGYLNDLPYEEQLHWKQYNEEPKAPMAKRAIAIDFHGLWYDEYNPLQSLKNKLEHLHRIRVGWWNMRSEAVLDKVLYPFTSSRDEWADEIMNLDQLLVEGFEEKWLQRKAKELGRNPDVRLRALKLLEECLIGVRFEEDHAHKLMSPFHDVHNLRSILKGHAGGSEAGELRKQALKEFGSFRKHFTDLCARCDESLGVIMEAFREF